jgi:hypothetical protein
MCVPPVDAVPHSCLVHGVCVCVRVCIIFFCCTVPALCVRGDRLTGSARAVCLVSLSLARARPFSSLSHPCPPWPIPVRGAGRTSARHTRSRSWPPAAHTDEQQFTPEALEATLHKPKARRSKEHDEDGSAPASGDGAAVTADEAANGHGKKPKKKKESKEEKEARLAALVKATAETTLTAELGDIHKQMEEIMAETRRAEEERSRMLQSKLQRTGEEERERMRLMAEQLEEERRSKERLMEEVSGMRSTLGTPAARPLHAHTRRRE